VTVVIFGHLNCPLYFLTQKKQK